MLLFIAFINGCSPYSAFYEQVVLGAMFVDNNYVPDKIISEYMAEDKKPTKKRYFLVIHNNKPAFYEYYGENKNTLITNMLETESDYQFGLWIENNFGENIQVPKDINQPAKYTIYPRLQYKIMKVKDVLLPVAKENAKITSINYKAVPVGKFPP